MRRLICTFVVRIWLKQIFSWHGSFISWAGWKTMLGCLRDGQSNLEDWQGFATEIKGYQIFWFKCVMHLVLNTLCLIWTTAVYSITIACFTHKICITSCTKSSCIFNFHATSKHAQGLDKKGLCHASVYEHIYIYFSMHAANTDAMHYLYIHLQSTFRYMEYMKCIETKHSLIWHLELLNLLLFRSRAYYRQGKCYEQINIKY